MDSATLLLRKATPTDVGPLLQLSRQTFMEAFAAQNKPENMAAYMEDAFTEAQLAAELRDEASTFFLVFSGNELKEGNLVGYAKLRTSKMQPALADYRAIEIQRIYVLERMKGRKIGKLLMQTCLDTAQSQGFEVVWLGVWEHNPAAIAFYQRWGFAQFSSYIFHFGDEDQTDLLFRKFLR
ncbi:MAG: GNAT family N-acetyltransferase [Bacteroidota bacterium]